MGAIEEMAKPILICVAVLLFCLVDPPLDTEGGPLQFLSVQGLIEVGGISTPDEFLVNIHVECALGRSNNFLHLSRQLSKYK